MRYEIGGFVLRSEFAVKSWKNMKKTKIQIKNKTAIYEPWVK